MFSRERAFRAMLARYLKLFRSQLRLPFGIGFLNLKSHDQERNWGVKNGGCFAPEIPSIVTDFLGRADPIEKAPSRARDFRKIGIFDASPGDHSTAPIDRAD